MLSKLIDALFGCRHARYSFPITVRAGSRRTPTARRTGTYVACLDCGREFRYDWHAMKIVGRRQERPRTPWLRKKPRNTRCSLTAHSSKRLAAKSEHSS